MDTNQPRTTEVTTAGQYEEQFGANHTFLIDFYHVGEYLAAAAKEAEAEEVIGELAELHGKHPEKESVADCLRYLSNRSEHLGYAAALEKGLPIGSWQVESGHRSVLQKRLKKPGAWWARPNAETMAQLKTLQANGDWDKLWKKMAAQIHRKKSHPLYSAFTPARISFSIIGRDEPIRGSAVVARDQAAPRAA